MKRKLLASLLGLGLLLAPLASNAATVLPTGRAYSNDLTITSGTTNDNATEIGITVLSAAGISSTTVSSVSGFAAGNYVMLYQVQGTGAGGYEFQKIRSIVGSSLFFYGTLANSYQSTGAEVVKVSEYHNVTITGGTWTAASWDGSKGGILVAFLTGQLSVTGSGAITAPAGFTESGGAPCAQGSGNLTCFQGDSSTGAGAKSTSANGMAGGGGHTDNGGVVNAAGGGGGYGAGGSTGGVGSGGSPVGGAGGGTGGAANLQTGNLLLGSSGGAGACSTGSCSAGAGGTGAGDIFILSASTTVSGSASITASGSTGTGCNNGTNGGAAGGGGSGGGIRLPVRLNMTIGSSLIAAAAGAGGSQFCSGNWPSGGAGGVGRIGTVSAATVSGTASPSLDTSSTDYVYDIDNTATPVLLGNNF